MKSVQRRISRAVVIGVSATLALGGIFWLYKYTSPRTATASQQQGRHPAPAANPNLVQADVKVASASTLPTASKATSQPAATPPLLAAAAPTSQPAAQLASSS